VAEVEVGHITMKVVWEAYLEEQEVWDGHLEVVLLRELIQTLMDMVVTVEEVKLGILGLS
jgi:hypothetical protein